MCGWPVGTCREPGPTRVGAHTGPGRPRSSDGIALGQQWEAGLGQDSQIAGLLHALGDEDGTDLDGEPIERPEEGLECLAAAHASDEIGVEFDVRRPELGNVAHRGKAGTDIIDREPYAAVEIGRHRPAKRDIVVDGLLFRDLDNEGGWIGHGDRGCDRRMGEMIRDLSEGLDDRRRGVYLFDLAYSYRNTGDFEAAIRAGTASLALLRAAQAEFEAASLQRDLALSYLALGNSGKAEESVRAARGFFERLGDRYWLSYVTDTEAQIKLANGDPGQAAELAAQALELAEETSNDFAALGALLTLARAQKAQGLNSEVMALYERAADLARREGKPARIRQVLGEFAESLATVGNHERAFALMREALKAG